MLLTNDLLEEKRGVTNEQNDSRQRNHDLRTRKCSEDLSNYLLKEKDDQRESKKRGLMLEVVTQRHSATNMHHYDWKVLNYGAYARDVSDGLRT